jgi:hypothetical protein
MLCLKYFVPLLLVRFKVEVNYIISLVRVLRSVATVVNFAQVLCFRVLA